MVVSEEEFIWEKNVHQAGFTMTFAFISSLWFILPLESKLISSRSKPIISNPKLHGNNKVLWILLNSFIFIFSCEISSLTAQMLQNHYFLKTKTVALQMFHLTQIFGVQLLVCQARLSLKLCPQSWVCSALLCLWTVLPNAPQIQLLYP